MTFSRFLRSALLHRVKFIRPFWYLQYTKEDAKALLSSKYDWHYYGGHHLENRMTAFYHSVYLPEKFGTDMRNNSLSASVRSGAMNREDAWSAYNKPPYVEVELVTYFKKRLELSDSTYETIMKSAPRSWMEFPTYKKRFERFRWLFAILAQAELVPMSFFLKYCHPLSKTA